MEAAHRRLVSQDFVAQLKINVHTNHLQIIVFYSINCYVAEMTSRIFSDQALLLSILTEK